MELQRTIKAVIRKGEDCFVVERLEIAAVTQGRTLDETVANLKEAVKLFLEGEDPAEFSLCPNPIIVLTFEVELALA